MTWMRNAGKISFFILVWDFVLFSLLDVETIAIEYAWIGSMIKLGLVVLLATTMTHMERN